MDGDRGAVWSAAVQAEQAGRQRAALTTTGAPLRTMRPPCTSRSLQRAEAQLDIWRRQRSCWERWSTSPGPGERVLIPYEHTALPGFFFPAADRLPGERRPLVVVNNGLDVPTSETWACVGAPLVNVDITG